MPSQDALDIYLDLIGPRCPDCGGCDRDAPKWALKDFGLCEWPSEGQQVYEAEQAQDMQEYQNE